MEDDDHRQFKEANAAVTRAVAAFVSEIESMSGSGKTSPPVTSSRARCWTCPQHCPCWPPISRSSRDRRR